MTVGNVLFEADVLRESAYDREQKLLWLSRVEDSIYQRLLSCRQQNIDYTPITAETEDDRELLAPESFGEVYLYYLLMQIDLHNGEFTRYNNTAALYNNAFTELGNYYTRRYSSKGRKETKVM